MIKTKSQAIGFAEDLCTLTEQYTSEVVRSKLEALNTKYPIWRRCRGDGNCYYRALGFAYVEKLITLTAEKDDETGMALFFSRLMGAHEVISNSDGGSEAIEIVRSCATSLTSFYKSIIGDAQCDAALVWCIRGLIADYLIKNANEDFNGIPLKVALDALGFSSPNDFVKEDVLRWGAEAESLVQTVSPFALDDKLCIRMMQIDSTECDAQYTFRNDKVSSDGSHAEDEIEICLLFKPGHYDILYSPNEGKHIQMVETDPEVQECREVVLCTICMDDEATADRPLCGCSVGFCADCQESYVQNHIEMYTSSRSVPCPSCNSPWLMM